MVSSPDKWPWSSFMATAGYEMKPGFMHTDWLLGLFDSSKPEAEKQYTHFVEEGLTCENPLKKAKGGFILGREGFVKKREPCLISLKRKRQSGRSDTPHDHRSKKYLETSKETKPYTNPFADGATG